MEKKLYFMNAQYFIQIDFKSLPSCFHFQFESSFQHISILDESMFYLSNSNEYYDSKITRNGIL